ncbi:MAG TPA: S1/P1 nuclease [Candidatus Sulfotelmatobacter sp.]|nr:S1/P1 nuclease [Candidatus Sulfotelmatobacter sp.]
MAPLRVALLLITAALALGAAPAAWGWGCEGHQTVALIAKAHLNPHALAMVEQILRDNPIDPALQRYCPDPALDPMADSSTWADDYRNVHPETGGWHFFDIPRGALRANIDQFCDPAHSCVAKALADQIAVLKNTASAPGDRGNALRFVLHFAGDIHQPLHDTTNNDRGANCVPVTFFNTKVAVSGGSYKPNLHAVWDTDLIERIAKGQTVVQFAAALDKQFQSQEAGWQAAGINFDSWAWDAHELAESTAYGKLNKKIPIEKPVAVNSCADDNNIGARMLKLKEKIDANYEAAAAPVIEEQLAKAGIRLAMILNEVWP